MKRYFQRGREIFSKRWKSIFKEVERYFQRGGEVFLKRWKGIFKEVERYFQRNEGILLLFERRRRGVKQMEGGQKVLSKVW